MLWPSLFRDYVIQDVFVTTESSGWDLSEVASSEVRIVLLYCTRAEAGPIMREARRRGLTSPQFMWLATQSVVGDPGDFVGSGRDLPVGMIGD